MHENYTDFHKTKTFLPDKKYDVYSDAFLMLHTLWALFFNIDFKL